MSSESAPLVVRLLGRQPYEPLWHQMQAFTNQRDATTPDELWVLEHEPVFTQGQAGKAEHLLNPGDIPVVKVDRGGQVTWHGPGQLIIYLLLDVRRLSYGVRDLVNLIEESLIEYLASLGIDAHARPDAPGVYIRGGQWDGAKIAALGLKIRRGCSFHGLSFNITCELGDFLRINPCGYAGMRVVRLLDLLPETQFEKTQQDLLNILLRRLGVTHVTYSTTLQELA
ncbi:MAG: lipoyl(octanoyl) transferase LipB [Marinospirillum sp.]|uniref:lipoyl(octanoyl) transferase LipB n=1 Tax=Marinospirillum sp. TaxID=2183934 RepID=UPI001A0FE285|nr:lipoyl(octanoyl) transferase LipB [Marinospirillum sp.]MBE0505619.1 lipoyl(octanoyl) transferase LipB [Marinospirillum sp.]